MCKFDGEGVSGSACSCIYSCRMGGSEADGFDRQASNLLAQLFLSIAHDIHNVLGLRKSLTTLRCAITILPNMETRANRETNQPKTDDTRAKIKPKLIDAWLFLCILTFFVIRIIGSQTVYRFFQSLRSHSS